jgi:hypothetical protein
VLSRREQNGVADAIGPHTNESEQKIVPHHLEIDDEKVVITPILPKRVPSFMTLRQAVLDL